MPLAVQDRPAARTADAPRPRGRSTAVRLGGFALVGVLAVVGADRALDLLPDVHNPLQEQVVDRSQPALMVALQDLSEYHAAQGTYQVVVDREKDTPWVPGFVKGERTTYLATGTVDGLVDFRGLDQGAVQVTGRAVHITLPRPRLSAAAVDPARSRVVARDRGLVDRVGGAFSDSPTSEREVAALAQEKVARAAAESDLRRRAEGGTRSMLTGLARSLGYTDVTVTFDADAAT